MTALELLLVWRRLCREKKFGALVISTLAIGIGSALAAFSVLDSVLLHPLPYRQPRSLVAVLGINPARGITNGNASIGDFVYWRQKAHSLHGIAATGYAELVLTGAGEPERITTAAISWNFLRVLGVRPLLGRDFLPQEETPGRDQVLLLSHSLWLRRFGGDPGVVGKVLTLSGYRYEVVGVMPAEFRFHGREVGFWSPMALDLQNLVRQRRGINVVARLRSGVTLVQASQEMQLLAAQLAKEYPETNEGWSATVKPLGESVTQGSRAYVGLAFVASLVLLGSAMANAASLIAAHSLSRRQEMSIRVASGARWRDLVRLQWTESSILGILGTLAGAALAGLGLRLLTSLDGIEIPHLEAARVNPVALVAALAMTLAGALGLSVVSVLRAAAPPGRGAPLLSLSKAGPRSRRSNEVLVVAELSLALVLLCSSALLLRSLQRVVSIDPGFDPSNVVVMNVALPFSKYPEPAGQAAFFAQLGERLRHLPQVTNVAASSAVPLNGAALNVDLEVTRTDLGPGGRERAALRLVTPHYFDVMRIPIRAGRDLSDQDRPGTVPVALINETLAKRLWPRESPLGRHLQLTYEGERAYEIVGVVGDVRQRGFEQEAGPEVFLPYRQHPLFFESLVVKTAGRPGPLLRLFKSTLWTLDSEQDMTLSTMEDLVDHHLLPRRFIATLLSIFTVIAVAIAVLGTFSLSALVSQRQKVELSIRSALGAQAGQLIQELLRRTLTLTAVGSALGLAGTYLISRHLQSLLFGVGVLDPVTLAGATCVLATAAVLGSYLPARRAAKLDPMDVLRRS